MEMKFLYSTRSGKTSIPEDDGDKLYMNIAIPRANTKKSIETYLKHYKSSRIPKIYPDNP